MGLGYKKLPRKKPKRRSRKKPVKHPGYPTAIAMAQKMKMVNGKA